MTKTQIFNKIEYYRGHYKDHTKLSIHIDALYNNATEDMISLATNTKYAGIEKLSNYCEELNHKEQDELYQFITTGRPKVKEIDLKFQEIMLRK
jgi:hypothetical protein